MRVATLCESVNFFLRRLCHSAFVRVATSHSTTIQQSSTFATAHSCGLRRPRSSSAYNAHIFATAHSCGLRRLPNGGRQEDETLPQRIRAGCDGKPENQNRSRALCHSAFVRVATLPRRWSRCQDSFATAHSCGLRPKRCINSFPAMPLCHSAFVRVATKLRKAKNIEFDLCHSAFVRVATRHLQAPPRHSVFATAHSCGLRHANSEKFIAIIHLCHSAFVRVATWRICRGFHRGAFATAHSCGLRRDKPYVQYGIAALCHSAFVRVATPLKYFDCKTGVLCHSAFVRVATPQSPPFLSPPPSLPQRIRAGCDAGQSHKQLRGKTLPQRIRAGCDQQGREFPSNVTLCHSAFVRVATF